MADHGNGEGHDADHEHGNGEGHDADHEHGNGEADGNHGHGHHHHDLGTVRYAVVTVSSSRDIDDDEAGDLLVAAIEDAGHESVQRELIPDDYDRVQETVGRLADREDVDVVVTTGGTGVTPDDVTVEAAEQLFEKRLPGFGELFRTLSREEVGTRVVGTRATAGIVPTDDDGGVPTFCLPGSTNAVRLGIEDVILPEAGHLAGLAGRGASDDHGEDDSGHAAEAHTHEHGEDAHAHDEEA
jgi:molybdenum cofactor biosynthesis protein B